MPLVNITIGRALLLTLHSLHLCHCGFLFRVVHVRPPSLQQNTYLFRSSINLHIRIEYPFCLVVCVRNLNTNSQLFKAFPISIDMFVKLLIRTLAQQFAAHFIRSSKRYLGFCSVINCKHMILYYSASYLFMGFRRRRRTLFSDSCDAVLRGTYICII